MGKITTATFEGASGTKYRFNVYTLDTEFENFGAVYAFTRRTKKEDGTGTHTFLYIGESGELGDRISGHEKWSCVQEHKGNCICVHEESSSKTRLKKEADLLELEGRNPPCND